MMQRIQKEPRPPTPVSAAPRPPHALNIVHVVTSLEVGGMEQFVLRIAAQQHRRGHCASILSIRGGPLEEEALRQGIPTATLQGKGKTARLLTGLRIMAQLRPDVAHAHNPGSLDYAVLARFACGARVVMTRHGEARKLVSPLQWRFTDAVVAVSYRAEQALHRLHPDQEKKVSLIHNGVEPPAHRADRGALRAALGLETGPVGIIVARIDGQKGHDTLLQALALLQRRGVPLTVLVAGDGSARTGLEQQAASLNLGDDRVRFLGFRSDVPDLLDAVDLFVLPSLIEGLPLSVLEAMAHRLPVVATPVGGIPELIDHGVHGLMTPVNDAEALATALEQLVREPALRTELAESAFRRMMEQFTFDTMLDRYDQLYLSLRPARASGA